MATVDDLIDLIYHEKQEPGSMLCAQHALNSLLQGRYFTPPDLSDIARTLDEQEAQYDDDNPGRTSTNMDDTGFFSVQVLEKALQVWGLTLVRWRSEGMRPFQAHPHTQIAFILNLEQHWYTLRRFGMASPDPYSDADSTVGHWFNLNSFLETPEWISKLYLGVLLQQAETEGYSVFAVVQENPDVHLPPSPADQLAATIPEQFHRSASRRSTARTAPQADVKTPMAEGFEDEDMELQAALQASLMGGAHDFPSAPAFVPPRASSSAAGVLTPTGRQFPAVVPAARVQEEEQSADVEELDPVAASMARNRAFLQRMQREQEAALREGYQEEAARVESAAARRRATGLPEEDDEDEMLRRAIAESEAMARSMQAGAASRQAEGDEGDAELDELDDEAPFVPPPPIPLQTASTSRFPPHRVYDDEDAELQAALRASLEGMPPGFEVPDSPPRPALRTLPGAPGANVPVLPPPAMQWQPSGASESGTETETESEAEQPPVEQLSMEEIRRRRLARFGG